jgi:hypothetical protein
MKKVERNELLALAAYEEIRPHFRARMIEAKKLRRIALGANMSLVFENHDTMLLQVQEMLRTERITDEAAIAHELETYNELVPPPGSLSGTLFIEYDEAKERATMLERLATVRDQIHITIGDARITAKFATHFGEEMHRLPAVNYLSFEIGAANTAKLRDASVPVRFEVTHPDYTVAVDVPRELRAELIKDLA